MAVTSMPQQNADSPRLGERRLTGLWSFDYWLGLVAVALLVFGLLVVYSTTLPWSLSLANDTTTIFMRQVQWLLVGLVVVAVILRADYRWLQNLSIPLIIVTIGLLLAVLATNNVIFGAKRGLFNGSVQPGELAKLATIVYLAHWLSSKGNKLHSVSLGLLPFAVVVSVIVILIMLQPDMSTALLILFTAITMFFLSGSDGKQVFAGVAVAVGVVVLMVWLSTWLQPLHYIKERLDEWLTALADPSQATWHLQQAWIAIGSGGLAGEGLGVGALKWGVLPTPHTDSVFAVIGEELGLVGTLTVVALFTALVVRGFKIAREAEDEFGYTLAMGITCSLGYEALINMAVITGIFPFTGSALPFMSYGGSSLLVSMALVAILLSISRGALRPAKAARTRAHFDGGRRDRGPRVPRARSRG
jgi:cell division protein FtsW